MLPTEWSFDDNNRLYHSLTQEQRDTALQSLPPLTTNFSLDYPKICTALNIQQHPTLTTHIAAFKPSPPPPPQPASLTTLPLPDTSLTAQPILSPPISARKVSVTPRPAAASTAAVKGGKKIEAKTPAGKGGKKEEAAIVVAVTEEKKEEEKKAEVPVDERDTIALIHTSIDDGTLAALVIALAVNRHIRCLRLQYSTMTEAAVRMLPSIVSKSCVQRLYIDRITLTQPTDSSAPHPLLAILPALATSNVQLLSLSSNGLTDADSAAIAGSLTNNAMLAALTLSNNHLGASTAAALSAALLLNTTLAYLNLSHNPLTSPHLLALLAPLTHAAIDPPPKSNAAAPAAGSNKAVQPPATPYRVQGSKESKSWYREANSALRQLCCDGCAMGGTGDKEEVVERVRQVLAARLVAVEGVEGAATGGGAVGQCNVLERLGLQFNDWSASEWSALSVMSPVVVVELERTSKHVRARGAPLPASTPTTVGAVDAQADVAAA